MGMEVSIGSSLLRGKVRLIPQDFFPFTENKINSGGQDS